MYVLILELFNTCPFSDQCRRSIFLFTYASLMDVTDKLSHKQKLHYSLGGYLLYPIFSCGMNCMNSTSFRQFTTARSLTLAVKLRSTSRPYDSCPVLLPLGDRQRNSLVRYTPNVMGENKVTGISQIREI